MPQAPEFSERATLVPGDVSEISEDEAQRALATRLSNSSDPHVRLIAHMAQRQLDMAQQLSELARDVKKLMGLIDS